MSRPSPLIDVHDLSHVVSECQILECRPSGPSLLHTACVFVPGSSGGWFRRIGMEVGSVTVLWWRRSREECVGREGLYKASQQLWVTNTQDGHRTGAANQLKSFSPVSSPTSTSTLACCFKSVALEDWLNLQELHLQEEFERSFPHSSKLPECPHMQWRWATWMLWPFTECPWLWRNSPRWWACPGPKTATGPAPSCNGRSSSAATRSLRRWMRKDRSQWRKTKHCAPSCSRLRVCADARKDVSKSRSLQAGLDLILNLNGLRDWDSVLNGDYFKGTVKVDASQWSQTDWPKQFISTKDV